MKLYNFTEILASDYTLRCYNTWVSNYIQYKHSINKEDT